MKKKLLTCLFFSVVISSCNNIQPSASNDFTLIVIPDTQNMTDFTHQKNAGFAIDSSEIFIAEMQYIASQGIENGGNVAFVASVGDVWQHATSNYDKAHFDRGVTAIDNPILAGNLTTYSEVLSFEVPKSIEGFQLLSDANIPFGVAPGNHDYDALWSASAFPPNLDKDPSEREFTTEDLGTLHLGGLANFRRAFGADTEFFKDKPWYIDSLNGGDNSAQIFSAAGYQFLHFAFEMHAGDDVLAWAQQVIDANPGIPTIITTHDYMDRFGERVHKPFLNLAGADPGFNNTAEDIWNKFISKNDQVFMVLCGHNLGQALRVDLNDFGHKVYQIMSDYQERGQAGIDGGQSLKANGDSVGVGDGWIREMNFSLGQANPMLEVRTYSSHYKLYSADLETYADWYKGQEQPELADEAFYQTDEYSIALDDFFMRFKKR